MQTLQQPVTRRLEVDQDVYDFLKDVSELGESPSSILRRLLKISAPVGQSMQALTRRDSPSSPIESQTDAILEHLQSDGFRFLRNATDRYLNILSAAYKADPSGFDGVCAVSGSSRRYFAKTSAEISRTGKNTAPRQIPNTPYFALTNADTSTKIDMLERALGRLGYSSSTARKAAELLP